MASENSVVTRARRISLAKITSGAVSAISPIAFIALGDAGVDESGKVIPPSEEQTALRNEIARYSTSAPAYPVITTARYEITVPQDELVGKSISEAALIDGEGTLCAIRNMLPKTKDSDEEFTFIFDDEF